MKTLLEKAIRFILIDIQYLSIENISLITKLKNILITDYNVLKNALFQKKGLFNIKLEEGKYKCDTLFGTKSFLVGVYDFYNESKRASIFSKKPTIIDIGANIGQYLYSIKALVPEAKVHSIEANPNIFALLQENSKNYKNVKVSNLALSDKDGEATFYLNKKFSTWSTLEKPTKNSDYDRIQIKTIRGDKLFKSISSIDLLKIDVEGAELRVLEGMKGVLGKTKYLMVEISLTREVEDFGSNKLIKYILDNNFQMVHIGRIFTKKVGTDQSAANILFKKNK